MDGLDRFDADARRVLVVDDSEVVRMKLRGLIHEDRKLELVGEAPDGETGVEMAGELRPDLVVMDLRMPGMSGIKATWELGERTPDSKVLVLTVSDDPEDVADAIMAGATGYVVKGADDEEVRSTIHRVAEGEQVLSHQVAGALVERARTHSVEHSVDTGGHLSVVPENGNASAGPSQRRAARRTLSVPVTLTIAAASLGAGVCIGAFYL